ncbi:MAG: hypothetical protein OXC62_12520 [Aestuariivita sp.]|nr:hypothetical protein [Aestuariivita sp.]
MNTDLTILTDEIWERIELLISEKATGHGRTNGCFLKPCCRGFSGGCKRVFLTVCSGVLSKDFDCSVVSVDSPLMQAYTKASGSLKGEVLNAQGAD